MLTTYQNNTQDLLQLPGAPTTLYPAANVTTWVNIARGQLAGESECIRLQVQQNTAVGTTVYNFSGLNIGTSATNGIAGVLHIRSISYNLGNGRRWITPRPWPWFELYNLNDPDVDNGPPMTWSQYKQGGAPDATGATGGGSFYIDPPPDGIYTLNCDCVCYPISLVDDTTVEAIPYMWTDAVPFFAAYRALLSSQTSARQADAERMFKHYETFVERARKASNPSVLRFQYEQAGDPVQATKIGLNKAAGG